MMKFLIGMTFVIVLLGLSVAARAWIASSPPAGGGGTSLVYTPPYALVYTPPYAFTYH